MDGSLGEKSRHLPSRPHADLYVPLRPPSGARLLEARGLSFSYPFLSPTEYRICGMAANVIGGERAVDLEVQFDLDSTKLVPTSATWDSCRSVASWTSLEGTRPPLRSTDILSGGASHRTTWCRRRRMCPFSAAVGATPAKSTTVFPPPSRMRPASMSAAGTSRQTVQLASHPWRLRVAIGAPEDIDYAVHGGGSRDFYVDNPTIDRDTTTLSSRPARPLTRTRARIRPRSAVFIIGGQTAAYVAGLMKSWGVRPIKRLSVFGLEFPTQAARALTAAPDALRAQRAEQADAGRYCSASKYDRAVARRSAQWQPFGAFAGDCTHLLSIVLPFDVNMDVVPSLSLSNTTVTHLNVVESPIDESYAPRVAERLGTLSPSLPWIEDDYDDGEYERARPGGSSLCYLLILLSTIGVRCGCAFVAANDLEE
ncbi:hypothetical protein EV714DRAFT_268223 [Schizophyllum commune]